MLNVDISNIWCSVSLPGLLETEQEIAQAHADLTDGRCANFLTWLDDESLWLPELQRVEQAAAAIRASSQVLVVVGNDSAVHGAKALLHLLRGTNYNQRTNGVEILFAGQDLSTRSWQELSEKLESKDFSVHILSRKGQAVESALTVRSLRWLLARRFGAEKARERVFLTTDQSEGVLRQLSMEEGYTTFNMPRVLAGHSSVLAPSALLCLAVAGVDVRALLSGAAAAKLSLAIRSFENPAWLYAAARVVLGQKGKAAEYLCLTEPDAAAFGVWWQRLFGSRACFGGRGLLPMVTQWPSDLESLHALQADGTNAIVETVLRFDPPTQKIPVEMDWKDMDGLHFLEGYTVDYIQEQAVCGAVTAAVAGSVPLVTMDCGAITAENLGELCYFFELTSCLSAGMLGRDLYARERTAECVRAMREALGG